MPIILAHRGNAQGPSPRENRREPLRAALQRGWGVEVDLRRTNGRFYLSHDPGPARDDQLAETFFADVRGHPGATVAINIKECGYEEAIVDFLREHAVLDQVFLFDMELVEQRPGESARRFKQLHPQITLAARVSDRQEPVDRALAETTASVIWLDEFDGPWATEEEVGRLKASGRTVHAVSPELHGCALADAQTRWAALTSWGVDGICTDYPEALEVFLSASLKEAAA